jgi:hypothetical protein
VVQVAEEGTMEKRRCQPHVLLEVFVITTAIWLAEEAVERITWNALWLLQQSEDKRYCSFLPPSPLSVPSILIAPSLLLSLLRTIMLSLVRERWCNIVAIKKLLLQLLLLLLLDNKEVVGAVGVEEEVAEEETDGLTQEPAVVSPIAILLHESTVLLLPLPMQCWEK